MASHPAQPVPHLTTALSGPLHQIEKRLLEQQAEIESWFRAQWLKTRAPFYASVDLRNAGFKLAPVDTNLFPAGFNNLNPAFEPLCIQAFQVAVERFCECIDRILIVPESHTRNRSYFEHLAALQGLLEKAGFQARLGSLIPDLASPMSVTLDSGRRILLEPLERSGDRLHVGDFEPDLVLLNNDLSGGLPDRLKGIQHKITPPVEMGWSTRSKSVHFDHYQRIAAEFGRQIGLDPWLIDPMFRNCGEIDFMKRTGEACLAKNVESLLKAIQAKYDEYGVRCQPFVMIKADYGTYGMGVMPVHSAQEVAELNRKQRTRMATVKEGRKVTRVIIQEGVYTYETWGKQQNVAEPVVYLIDHNVVGGFYRVHAGRGANENLNAPGMRFEPLAFDDCCISPDPQRAPDAHPNRFYAYGVIARLALLAAAREMQGQMREA
jgi:glutamate--cysteine ligase